jgi:hypothetical protein
MKSKRPAFRITILRITGMLLASLMLTATSFCQKSVFTYKYDRKIEDLELLMLAKTKKHHAVKKSSLTELTAIENYYYEEDNKLECWMLCEKTWCMIESIVRNEPLQDVEEWMVNLEIFAEQPVLFSNNEKDLKLEKWMMTFDQTMIASLR